MATATMDGAHRARRQAGRVELGSSSPTSNASIGIRGGAAAMEHRRSLGVAMASWAKGAAMATASLRRSGAARRQRARGGERLEVLHGGGGRSSSARLQRRLSFSLSSRRVAAAPLLPPLLLSPARLLLFWPRGQLVWVRRWGVTVRRGSCQRGRRQDAQAAWRGRPRRIRARGARHRGGSGGGGRASSPPTALDGLVLELRRRSLGEGGAGPWSRRSTRRRRSSSVEHRISSSRRRRSSSVEHRTTEAAAPSRGGWRSSLAPCTPPASGDGDDHPAASPALPRRVLAGNGARSLGRPHRDAWWALAEHARSLWIWREPGDNAFFAGSCRTPLRRVLRQKSPGSGWRSRMP
jgi:hypothetical protein